MPPLLLLLLTTTMTTLGLVQIPSQTLDRGLIWFEAGALNPASYTPDAGDGDPINGTYVVQVRTPTESERHRLARQYGAVPGGYVPHAAYLFYGGARQMRRMAADPDVLWVGPLPRRLKLSRTLLRTTTAPRPRFFSVPELGEPLAQLVVELTAADPDAVRRLRRAPGVTNVAVVGDGRRRLVVDVDGDLADCAEAVAADPAVHWVERRQRHQFLNRWARSLILKGGANATADYASRTGLLSWDHGLDGTGQVLALGDSGLDKRSCFFASRRQCAQRSSWASPSGSGSLLFPIDSDVSDLDKIVAYVAYADSSDANGHGTHLAGTMAGDPQLPDGVRGTLPTFAGMAPGARLAIVDVGDASGAVQLPLDLQGEYFAPMYEVGARIMTSAWGSPIPLYTHEAADIDQYMADHLDFLVVTAAGNDGACNDEMTVVSPSTSKNAIAVGATLSLSAQYRKTDLVPPGFPSATSPELGPESVAAFSSIGPTVDGRIKPDVLAPGYFVFSAATGLGPNHCGAELGSVVTPNAGTSTAAAVVAGAAALVRQYFLDGWLGNAGTGRSPRHGFAPSAALVKAVLVQAGRRVRGPRQVGDRGIADPARCPRVQFVAPEPSADNDDEDVPSISQGWGRPELDQVLAFDADGGGGAQQQLVLHVLGRNNRSTGSFGDPELGPGQHHRYQLCVLEAQTEVRITLVWTDPAATLGVGQHLVNDLDLVVDVGDRNRSLCGNGAVGGDRRNPVERVTLRTARPISQITVHVLAQRVALGATQPYALIMSGAGIRQGPCRPHHEMLRAPSSESVAESIVLETAVRLLNTARGLRHRSVPVESSASSSSAAAPPSRVLTVTAACVSAIPVVLVLLGLLGVRDD